MARAKTTNAENTDVKNAENTAAETQNESAEKLYSREELDKIVDALVNEKLAQKTAETVSITGVSELKSADDDKVTVTNFWDCQGGMEVCIPYGNGFMEIFRSFGEQHKMPLSRFEMFAASPLAQKLISSHQLGVSDNCPDYILHNCELDGNKTDININILNSLLDMPIDSVLRISATLCDFHKIIIRKEIEKAIDNHDGRVSRELIARLNKQSENKLFEETLRLYDDKY